MGCEDVKLLEVRVAIDLDGECKPNGLVRQVRRYKETASVLRSLRGFKRVYGAIDAIPRSAAWLPNSVAA